MDFDGHPGAPASADEYSDLNDAQLRTAIRFAEKRLRWVEEDHVELRRAYHDEIDSMRGQLIDRLLTRMIAQAEPLSEEQRRELQHRFERRAMPAEQVALLVRAASRGRTEQLHALTEIEATALLLRLERDA
jgi:23S rRNA G2069 N7-methylase RlmK/C1962 C5-methylase RlmI